MTGQVKRRKKKHLSAHASCRELRLRTRSGDRRGSPMRRQHFPTRPSASSVRYASSLSPSWKFVTMSRQALKIFCWNYSSLVSDVDSAGSSHIASTKLGAQSCARSIYHLTHHHSPCRHTALKIMPLARSLCPHAHFMCGC